MILFCHPRTLIRLYQIKYKKDEENIKDPQHIKLYIFLMNWIPVFPMSTSGSTGMTT